MGCKAERTVDHADGDFIVEGKYQGGAKEIVDCAASQGEADALLSEYRMAYGAGWTLWTRRRTTDDD